MERNYGNGLVLVFFGLPLVSGLRPACRICSFILVRVVLAVGVVCASPMSGSEAEGLSADTKSAIDDTVAGFMRKREIPGCSLALGRDKQILHAQAYGLARPDAEATVQTVYRIGSLSKQFAAALTLMAARRDQERPINLDTPITKYFPDRKHWSGITIRNLLTHTSGIPSYTAEKSFRKGRFARIDGRALLRLVRGYRPRFAAGSRGHYSNTNYLLLAHILQKQTGRSYRSLLDDVIFSGLAIFSGAVISDDKPGGLLAQGSVKGKFVSKRTHSSWVMGAGDLQANVLDVARWDLALLGGDLLSDAEKEVMFTAVAANPGAAVKGERMAMGWMDISSKETPRYYHQGYVYGFSAVNYLMEPRKPGGRFVALLCNAHLVRHLPQLVLEISAAF